MTANTALQLNDGAGISWNVHLTGYMMHLDRCTCPLPTNSGNGIKISWFLEVA